MSFSKLFPAISRLSRFLWSVLAGRIARRVYFSTILVLVFLSVALRAYTYSLTRRMQAVVVGMGKLQIDVTSEQDFVQMVPQLRLSNVETEAKPSIQVGNVESGPERFYSITITNEPAWMKFAKTINFLKVCSKNPQLTYEGYVRGCWFFVPDMLGFRYVYFRASIVVLNGKVSRISYGVMDRLGFPRPVFEILSVTSFHSLWSTRHSGFEVSSMDDESPNFRLNGGEHALWLRYAYDASQKPTAHAFQIKLSCFWSLIGCRYVNQISPQLWQDRNAILTSTLSRLDSPDPCPDRILAGRARYLPDSGIVVLESKGAKPQTASQESPSDVAGTATQYKLVETVRGTAHKDFETIWNSDTIPHPEDYRRHIPNPGVKSPSPGTRVLGFSNMSFASCAIVPATETALSVVRNVDPAPRRSEDRVLVGLL